jgi:hypothetical protein
MLCYTDISGILKVIWKRFVQGVLGNGRGVDSIFIVLDILLF